MNTQTAPEPIELLELIAKLKYRERWKFTVESVDRGQGSEGLTLCILITTQDSYSEKQRSVMHYFPVPPAAYDYRSWQRWLFDRIVDVETHEAMEFFRFTDGSRPYAPNHGPGNDPYVIRELRTEEDQRTLYTGEVKV